MTLETLIVLYFRLLFVVLKINFFTVYLVQLKFLIEQEKSKRDLSLIVYNKIYSRKFIVK